MTKAEFYGWAIAQLIEAEVDIRLVQKRSSGKAGGSFLFPHVGDTAKFMVCLKSNVHFETFLHEFCHFLQWRDEHTKWEPLYTDLGRFFNWLDGKRKQNPTSKSVQHIELDCEKKAVKLIKKLKLPLDVKKYIQQANTYVFSYLLTEEYRHEFRAAGAICNEDIYGQFPDKFRALSYYRNKNNIPENALELLNAYY